MSRGPVLSLLASILAVTSATAAPPTGASAQRAPAAPLCDVASISDISVLNSALSRRAIEVANLAARPSWKADARLADLVLPKAEFSLGAGDAGHPLGTGTAGARSLVEMMHADSFRYPGWDYIPGPTDACASHKVTIDFSDTARGTYARVEFEFVGGRVVAGKSWAGTFTSGTLTRLAD